MRSWRGLMWECADRVKLPWLCERLGRQHGWCILWGHGIAGEKTVTKESYVRDVPVGVFREQMRYLLDRGYRFIGMGEGLRRLRSGLPLERCVTLTFDDGFRSVVEWGYPLMAEWDLKGVFYVVAGCVGTDRVLWTDMVDLVCAHRRAGDPLEVQFPDGVISFEMEDAEQRGRVAKTLKRKFRSIPEKARVESFRSIEEEFARLPGECIGGEYRFASWEELRELNPEILEVGNHTWSHPNLANVEEGPLLECEVLGAKRMIEERLGRRVDHFCYPAGSYNSGVIDAVSRAGHESGVTIGYGRNGFGVGNYELLRLGLPGTLAHFKARISGLERMVQETRRVWERS